VLSLAAQGERTVMRASSLLVRQRRRTARAPRTEELIAAGWLARTWTSTQFGGVQQGQAMSTR
jgi:hypothetical protein